MSLHRWLGIDFSGNHLEWRAGCTTSNVWVADVRRGGDLLRIHDVRPVQELAGSGAPFDRLVALLSGADYDAAGIDAPFSVPDSFVRHVGGHAALLALVGTSPVVGRPFVTGSQMVALVSADAPPLERRKPMRAIDDFWASKRVNVRSPVWTGARPGAPMTAACLTLLHRAGRPMWPWSSAGPGLLVEAFPAAQLQTWGLPHVKYDGRSRAAKEVRETILEGLSRRLHVGGWEAKLLQSADALDSVLCAFAAVAVTTRKVTLPEPENIETEGWVAVHPA